MRLDELVNDNYDKLNENDLLIWRYIQNHKRECCFVSIEELAGKCCISRTTISRFAQKLSFEGFREFKMHLKLEYEAEKAQKDVLLDDVCLNYVRCIQTVKDMDMKEICLLMLQLAKLAGASKTALLEPVEKKREMGRRMGADVCIDPLREEVGKSLSDAGMTWIRTVIECAGLPSTMEQAIDLSGKKGTVMMFGLTKPDAQIALKPFQMFQKELTLKASYINPCTQQRALQLIDSGRLDVESMVCGAIGLEQLEEVLRDPKLRAEGKHIVAPEKK